MNACYRAGMIGFVIFLAMAAGLLIGEESRLLRLSVRLAGGAAGARGDSRIIPGSMALTGIQIPGSRIDNFASRH